MIAQHVKLSPPTSCFAGNPCFEHDRELGRLFPRDCPALREEQEGDAGAAIVCAGCGKGKVVTFSPHPEGSLERQANPQNLGIL